MFVRSFRLFVCTVESCFFIFPLPFSLSPSLFLSFRLILCFSLVSFFPFFRANQPKNCMFFYYKQQQTQFFYFLAAIIFVLCHICTSRECNELLPHRIDIAFCVIGAFGICLYVVLYRKCAHPRHPHLEHMRMHE